MVFDSDEYISITSPQVFDCVIFSLLSTLYSMHSMWFNTTCTHAMSSLILYIMYDWRKARFTQFWSVPCATTRAASCRTMVCVDKQMHHMVSASAQGVHILCVECTHAYEEGTCMKKGQILDWKTKSSIQNLTSFRDFTSLFEQKSHWKDEAIDTQCMLRLNL